MYIKNEELIRQSNMTKDRFFYKKKNRPIEFKLMVKGIMQELSKEDEITITYDSKGATSNLSRAVE